MGSVDLQSLKQSSPSLWPVVRACWRREFLGGMRQSWESLPALGFFILFPFVGGFMMGDRPTILQQTAPLLIVLTAFLAMMPALERLFWEDDRQGVLDRLRLSSFPLWGFVFLKAGIYWIRLGVPVSLLSLADGLILSQGSMTILYQAAACGLMTFFLSFLGTFGSSLVLGAARSGFLLVLLVLPLSLPVLLLALWIAQAAADSLPVSFGFSLLGGLAILGALFFPVAAAVGLRRS